MKIFFLLGALGLSLIAGIARSDDAATEQLIQSHVNLPDVDCQQDANNICLNTESVPIVSVIIPVYGKCEYTIRCLASIAQNPPSESFEVIIVDDYSPDNTVEILSIV